METQIYIVVLCWQYAADITKPHQKCWHKVDTLPGESKYSKRQLDTGDDNDVDNADDDSNDSQIFAHLLQQLKPTPIISVGTTENYHWQGMPKKPLDISGISDEDR